MHASRGNLELEVQSQLESEDSSHLLRPSAAEYLIAFPALDVCRNRLYRRAPPPMRQLIFVLFSVYIV